MTEVLLQTSAGRIAVPLAALLPGDSGQLADGDPFRFDPSRLGTFKQALASRASAGVNVLCLGHSICEGDHANLSTRWQAGLATALRTRYPTAGVTGGVGSLPPQYLGGSADGNLPGSLPVVLVGAPADSGAGLGGRGKSLTTGKTATYTFTGTGFDLSYLKGSGGSATATYNIDGAGAVTLNTTNASTIYAVLQIRGLSPGAHTVVFSGGAAGTFFLNDVMVYNGDENAGIRFWDAGHSGAVASDFLDAGTNGTAYARYTLFGQPHLLIIESGGINEWGTVDTLRKSPRQMQADLLDMIDGIVANCTTVPSIIMFEDHKRGAAGSQFRGQWLRYTDAVRKVAREVGAVLFNSQTVLGDAAANANGWFASDLVHPLAAGHAQLASALDALIASA